MSINDVSKMFYIKNINRVFNLGYLCALFIFLIYIINNIIYIYYYYNTMLIEISSQFFYCFVCIFIVFVILHFYIIYCNKQNDIKSDDTINDLEKNISVSNENYTKKNIIYDLIDSINSKQQQFFEKLRSNPSD